jgi:hypothetical protein
MSEWKAADPAEWEQRWEQQAGYPRGAMRPGAYRAAVLTRWTIALALLLVIAASTWTIAIVELMNRNDAKEAGRAVAETLDASMTYDECLADEETTVDQCEKLRDG